MPLNPFQRSPQGRPEEPSFPMATDDIRHFFDSVFDDYGTPISAIRKLALWVSFTVLALSIVFDIVGVVFPPASPTSAYSILLHENGILLGALVAFGAAFIAISFINTSNQRRLHSVRRLADESLLKSTFELFGSFQQRHMEDYTVELNFHTYGERSKQRYVITDMTISYRTQVQDDTLSFGLQRVVSRLDDPTVTSSQTARPQAVATGRAQPSSSLASEAAGPRLAAEEVTYTELVSPLGQGVTQVHDKFQFFWSQDDTALLKIMSKSELDKTYKPIEVYVDNEPYRVSEIGNSVYNSDSLTQITVDTTNVERNRLIPIVIRLTLPFEVPGYNFFSMPLPAKGFVLRADFDPGKMSLYFEDLLSSRTYRRRLPDAKSGHIVIHHRDWVLPKSSVFFAWYPFEEVTKGISADGMAGDVPTSNGPQS